jgi:hypothetical protein
MKVAVAQINPSLGAVREKARAAGEALIFEIPGDAPERPGRAAPFASSFSLSRHWLVPALRHAVPRDFVPLHAVPLHAVPLHAVPLHAVLVLSVLLASCRSGEVNESAPAPAAAPAAAPERHTTQKASERKPPFASPPWRIPVGPNLVITPGKGLGPIRFGAKLETIERLIGEPCEEKRSEGDAVVCRYSAQAVDFVLRNGQLVQMRAHRLGRPFKPEPKLDYGIFNGRFAEGVAFGMLPGAVRELLGAPKHVQPAAQDNPNHTVEVHEYDGFSLEYDRLPSDSVVLGGVVLNAPKA